MVAVVGIVPARTGSQRVPNKNFRSFGGRPLVEHTIDHALLSNRLDRVVVSSDHPDPKAVVATRYLPLFIPRPAEIADGHAKGYTYVEHALEWLADEHAERFTHFVVLPPTAPLRRIGDIDDCVDKLLAERCDTVVTIVDVNHMFHGVKQKRLQGDRLEPAFESEKGRSAYTELPPLYVRNCAIYASRVSVLEGKSLIGADCRAVTVPPKFSVDINDELDFEFAEFLFNKQKVGD